MSTVIKQLTAQLKGLKDEMSMMHAEMVELKQLVKNLNDNVNALVEEVDLEAELNEPTDEPTEVIPPTPTPEPIAPKPQRTTVSKAGITSLAYLKKHAQAKEPPE